MNVSVARTTVHFARHHLFDVDTRGVAMFCCGRHANVAVCYHAHHFPCSGDHRQCAEVPSPHLHRCFGEIGFRTAGLHIISHYVLYFHIFSLSWLKSNTTPTERALRILRRTAQFLREGRAEITRILLLPWMYRG